MKALAWNCRGLGHPRSVSELTESVRFNRPDLVGLQETKIEERKLAAIQKRLGFKNGFVVPRQGLSGGLALWWNEEVSLTILSYSKYHIDACVEGEEVVRVTVFYGEPVTSRRGIMWDLLRRLHSQFSLPWIVFGDFNEVCFDWKVKGGRIRGEWQMRAFRETLLDCGLSDLGYKGTPFTFSNRRSGAGEMKARLDRMLANNAWRRLFPDAQVSHISATSSDHAIILLHSMVKARKSMNNCFRFEPMWIRNEELGDIVAAAWSNRGEMDTTLANKLHRCSKILSRWNSESFGKVGKRIRELEGELESVRLLERDKETIAREADIVEKIDEWRLREEILWRQRSRVEWLKEGDRNTRFFHAKATRRKKSNIISRMQNEEGVWLTDERQIGEVTKRYFTNIFSTSRGQVREDQNHSFSNIQRMVTAEMSRKLCEPVTATEVQASIFQMSPMKAPGPDGFHALFYQKFWHTIKDTVISKVLKVFEEGKMEEGMNDTLIVLIPKSKRPKKIEDYRPISLCNVSAKIVMKIFANRLKDILPNIISEMQSAFVPGRLISDNILLAHEVMRYIRSMKRQKTGCFSIKTDMSKAYDRMEWSFLKQMMIKLGFPEQWTRLVMECISSVRYKIKLNDLIIDIPPPERGLRQGDPLSPYLFLICSEWLSMKLVAEANSKRLKGVRVCQGAPMVSHLFFADDSVFFMKATEQNARRLRAILSEYEVLSGQRISAEKSEIVYSRNVAAPLRQLINGVFAVKEVEAHSKYLGLPLAFSHNKVELFKYIIQNTWKRIMGWKELQLSAAGKEVMLKSVLQALPIYAMMCYKLPTAVCKRLSGLMRKFWWSNDVDNRAIHWTNQTQLSMPKNQGGLNFRDLALFNDALLAKQYWRLMENPDSIISKTLKAKYYKDSDLLNSHLKQNCSMAWRGIWMDGSKVRRWICWDQNRRKLVWELEKHGTFTTKSAYLGLREDQLRTLRARRGEPSDSSNITSFWSKLWRLKLQGKMKIFIWRLFYDFLPTTANLLKKGCEVDLHCKVCGFSPATSMHLFTECWWARAFWEKLNIKKEFHSLNMRYTSDWIWWCVNTLETRELISFCYGARTIWYNRNLLLHDERGLSVDEASLSVRALANSFSCPTHRFTISDLEGSSVWTAPKKPYVKFNCDGVWNERTKIAGISGICRDDVGIIVGLMAEFVEELGTVLETEGLALLKSMHWALRQNLSHCIFETDCTKLFLLVTLRGHRLGIIPGWAREITDILLSREFWRLILVRREANCLADKLARLARDNKWSWSSVVSLPRLTVFPP
ncbi:unnamed protein product [Rhodiola kirilowii]